MSRRSARLIGREIGKNAKEVYLLLEKLGFIKKGSGRTMNGSPVWELTDLGRQHGEDSHNPYSLGFIWDSEVVDILKKVFKLLFIFLRFQLSAYSINKVQSLKIPNTELGGPLGFKSGKSSFRSQRP